MDEITRQVIRSWEWRPAVIIPLSLFLILFTTGWQRLRRLPRQAGRSRPQLAAGWRLAAYWLGVGCIALALLSPLDILASQLFFMHMIQHMFLLMLAPPLIWLSDPMPILVWGLPASWRPAAGRYLFQQASPVRTGLRQATSPAASWFLFFSFLWGWHSPDAYNLTLRNDLVHDLEHLTFFLPAMLVWWHIVGSSPRWHKRLSYLGRVAFALACVPVNMILGVAIALATSPIYTHYTTVPRLWNISVLTDQQISGVVMWIPGSMMFVLAAIVLVGRWLGIQADGSPESDAAGMARDKRQHVIHSM